ncbi:hypothetical protein Ancab_020024 [Ancistrocladus abbreviatus]
MVEGGGGTTLEFTPTWVVIIAIFLAVERCLHFAGKVRSCKTKIRSLSMRPCGSLSDKKESTGSSATEHMGHLSRLLAEGSVSREAFCASKDAESVNFFDCIIDGDGCAVNSSAPYFGEGSLAVKACDYVLMALLHHPHIFVFVLAIVHVTSCVLTVLFGGARICQWKHWEDSIAKENYATEQDSDLGCVYAFSDCHRHIVVTWYNALWTFYGSITSLSGRSYFSGKSSVLLLLLLLHSFFKQFYASVTKADYLTLRLGFIMTHCRGNLKFNFHKRALEDAFKHVVGIRLAYILLDSVHSSHHKFPFSALSEKQNSTFLCIRHVPQLLLAVGAKLEHLIAQLAHEVAEKHVAIEEDLVVQPSDDCFWFKRPEIFLFLIHFILFQNSFEIAYFFWMCNMVSTLALWGWRMIIQVLCSYSTLPLYAIDHCHPDGKQLQEGNIFDEHVQAGLLGWAQKAKNEERDETNAQWFWPVWF